MLTACPVCSTSVRGHRSRSMTPHQRRVPARDQKLTAGIPHLNAPQRKQSYQWVPAHRVDPDAPSVSAIKLFRGIT